MNSAYKYLLFLGINISLFIIIRLLFGISLLSSIGSNSIYGFAILFTLLGLLIGFLISLFFNNKQSSKPYWLGLTISRLFQGPLAFGFSYQQSIYSSNYTIST